MPDGRNGAVVFTALSAGTGSLSLRITRWDSEDRRDIHESTGFGNTSSRKDKEVGMGDVAGTAEGFSSADIPILDSLMNTTTSATMTLQEGTSRTQVFAAFVSNIRRAVQRVGALNTFTFSFESTGPVTVS